MSNLVRTRQKAVVNLAHREKMAALEAMIIKELEPVEFKEEHFFAEGTYTRVLHIPKGTVLTGKIHRHSCINIIPKGKLAVVTDEIEKIVSAPAYFVSAPGVKKAGYALEDTIWINVHPWEGEQDLEAIEHEMVVPSYEALEQEQRELLEAD